MYKIAVDIVIWDDDYTKQQFKYGFETIAHHIDNPEEFAYQLGKLNSLVVARGKIPEEKVEF